MSVKNIRYGNQSAHDIEDERHAESGLYLYMFRNKNGYGAQYTITKFCVPDPRDPDATGGDPWLDNELVLKQYMNDPSDSNKWPCVLLSAYAGDHLDTEFDFAVIDLTELAGVTDEIPVEEAKQIIINATGSLKDTYPHENVDKPVGYDIPQAGLRLYLPQYSADTNRLGNIYILTASTYIRGRYVNLGCFRFKRNDAIACPIKTFGSSEQYFECIDFKLPDLYNILYGDTTGIRTQLGYDRDYKNIYSYLNLSLYIVDWIPSIYGYIKSDECNSGQNSIMITESKELRTEISIDYEDEEFNIDWWIGKEKMTGVDTNHSIRSYIKDVYGVDPDNIKVSVRWVIMDSDDIYETGVTTPQPLTDTGYSISITNLKESFFDSWKNFKSGLLIRANVSLIDGSEYSDEEIINDEFVSFLIVFTNRILLTQDVFAKLLYNEDDDFPKTIKLKDINMNYNDIKVTNKIENVVVKNFDRDIEDVKNHIIQPIFYQSKPIDNIDIDPAVTENIALQLDAYKSVVKQFLMQVERQIFNEIRRSANGVIFKVIGKSLPKEVDSGIYYILDQDYNLVTSGMYNYKY